MNAESTGKVLAQFQSGLARFDRPDAVRIGAELKLPLVRDSGEAASRDEVESLWRFLTDRSWTADTENGRLIGASRPGEMNDTVGSSETGYCKTEFSLAHVADLHQLSRQLDELRVDLDAFTARSGLHFLGCGVHPVTPPGPDLRVKKERASVWGDIFRSNDVIPAGQGDDMDLFTVNAGSHVHVSLSPADAIDAVNVINGFAPAQFALNANASVWRNAVDHDHEMVSEIFWGWWAPARGRVGIPPEPFADLARYAEMIAGLDLLYVKRPGGPLTFSESPTLADFLSAGSHPGVTPGGETIDVIPEPDDLDLHNSCYWFNARVSRYFTVENRVNDQQPPDDLLFPATLTTGLAAALPEGREALAGYAWDDIVRARPDACRRGLDAMVGSHPVTRMIGEMLDVAELGLKRRGRGEEYFIEPVRARFAAGTNPARQARAIFAAGGAPALVRARTLARHG